MKIVEKKMAFIDAQAEKYDKRYRTQMEDLSKSLLCTAKGGLLAEDAYALGVQLDQFEQYVDFYEEAGSTNLLGTLPKIGFDVITAVHGSSIIPVIAAVQPIEEEAGLVWFKNVRSEDTRGSQTAGDIVRDPRTGTVTPSGYASGKIEDELNATADATLTYSDTLVAIPIRSESLTVFLASDPTIFGRDIGPQGADKNIGTILGAGMSGTINYITGDQDIVFAVNPGNSNIVSAYQQNFELAADIPQIQMFWDSKLVKAHPYALKGTFGMIQDFTMKKRFGRSAGDSISEDLVIEINKEIGGDLIRKLKAVALLTENFDFTPPASVSFFEHKQTYKDVLSRTGRNIVINAGRGKIAVLIAGLNHTALIRTLPGFTSMSDGSALGSQVIGTMDGMIIVEVKEANLLGANAALALWKGPTPFEAAAVFSPFMPLATTGTLPEAPNPLVNMKAAAVVAAVESLVPQFVTNMTVSNSP